MVRDRWGWSRICKNGSGMGLWNGGVIIVLDRRGWFEIVWDIYFRMVQYKWGWFEIGGDGSRW